MKKVITARSNTAGRITGAAVTAALLLTAPLIATAFAGTATADSNFNMGPGAVVKSATAVSDLNSHVVGHLTAGEGVFVGDDCGPTDYCLIFADLGGHYGKGYVYGGNLTINH